MGCFHRKPNCWQAYLFAKHDPFICMSLKITLKMQSFYYRLLQITLLGKGKIQTKLCRKYDEGCELFIRVQIFMFLIRSSHFIWDVPLPQYFCVYRHESVYLALTVPCISESCIEIKIKLNFYFHTSLRHHKEVWK